jgi:CheY-like chemotaxis protein
MSPDASPKPLVLIVEDNQANLLLTKAVLERSGFATEGAISAEEAMETLARIRPDVILMDLQLPGKDGLTFTRELRSIPALAQIPIVALSAHAMKDDRWRVLNAGCDGYIAKPIDTRAFAAQLEEILAETRAHGPQRR